MEETTTDISELGLEEYVNLQLSGSGPASFRRCIYKVPERLRKIREETYTPRLFSIGPLHHGAISFQAGEELKLKYANSYFSKFPDSERRSFFEKAKSWEKRARACYDGIIKLSSNEFSCMTLVDGIFTVEFLMKNVYPEQREADDEIFRKQWVCKETLRDMILLENQLPFFVIEYLFKRLKEVLSLNNTLLDLVHEVFRSALQLRGLPNILHEYKIVHLIDIFTMLSLGPDPAAKMEHWSGGKLVDNSCATELQEAGVKFVEVKKDCLYDIQFVTETGELKIPRLVVNQWTDSLLGNLNAFERCHYNGAYVSSYIILMDNLINTPADVDLLVGNGIIETEISSEDVCTLFNNLYKRTAYDDHKFLFTDLCKRLNAYSRDYWHQWKAACHKWSHMLKRDYFSNPWTIISVVAATVLLILTVIQTVCSAMALKRPSV